MIHTKIIDQMNFTEFSQTTYCFVSHRADFIDFETEFMYTYTIKEDTRDIFTALYFLRTKDLKRDTIFSIDAAGKLWIINSRFIGSETIRTNIGRFITSKVEVSFQQYDSKTGLRSDILTNNLVSDSNKLFFWFTDDELSIPVRASYNMRPFNVNWTIRSHTK
jgi:hypothetical protein